MKEPGKILEVMLERILEGTGKKNKIHCNGEDIERIWDGSERKLGSRLEIFFKGTDNL